MPPKYSPLWCKSNYSFLEGASHPEELVETAFAENLGALAVTDRNGLYGVVRAFDRARALGMPLILGAQVTVDTDSSLVLLAQNREGYARLCSLLSLGHQGHAKGQFHLTWEQIGEHSSDMIALWRPEAFGVSYDRQLATLADAFRGRAYAMVSRHRWIHDRLLEREALTWGLRYDLSPVAVTEVLYHHPDRQELQDVLTCLRHRVRLAEAGTKLRPNREHALKSSEEFLRLYDDHPEWVKQTLMIAEMCQFSLGELDYRYPEEGVPEGFTTAGWVRVKAEEGARQRYPSGIPPVVQKQMEKELDLIEELRYSGYFLTMWELVQFCQSQGILCQGRGSAANSVVCFCLGITAIDPTRVDLLFERFLSRERAEPPDIDLDIEHHRREEVIQYLYQRYGRHRAAMVANVVRFRRRSALREVGKVLDISEVDLDLSAKLLAHHEEGLAGAVRDSGLDLALAVNRRLIRLADQLQGFPRHLSIHPGGFLLGSEPLARIVPIENATMSGRTVIQWDKTDVETMNLFKVDLLGLGALTHLDYAFRLLKAHYQVDQALATIPGGDKAVFDMACRADTVGVFQIESRAQMAMLPRLKPRCYYDLVIQISLVRPGPITGGMVHPYLQRRAGLEPVTYPHELLRPVLEKTLGIPLFQEQVMRLAVVAADYTPGEADQLRRDMAAWKSTGRLEQHRDRLIGRMMTKGITREFAERVFDQIKGFGEYGFPESHAASFAHIAYATAWVKHHYPEVFACALLNAWPMGFYHPSTILNDARRHGVVLLPVDLRHSHWDCTLEELGDQRRFGLRIGLRYIQGLVQTEAQRLVALRGPRGPLTLGDWKSCGKVSPETWEKLAFSGALAGFGLNRRDALWTVLDSHAADPLALPQKRWQFSPPTPQDLLGWDHRAMGFSSQGHLLAPHRGQIRRENSLTAQEIQILPSDQRVRHIGLVICRQMPGTARGVLFLTLEDETGIVNVVVWKKNWNRFRTQILTSNLLGVEGRIQSEAGVVHVIADHIWSPPGILPPGELLGISHNFF